MPKFVNKWGESTSVSVTKPKSIKHASWYQMNGGNSNLFQLISGIFKKLQKIEKYLYK